MSRPLRVAVPRPPVLDAVALGAATAAFAGLAWRARTGDVTVGEELAFRTVNFLPPTIRAPVWVVMQAGNLATVAVAVLVLRRRDPVAAAGVGAAGVSVWATAKVVKRVVRRGRPADHLDHVRLHGASQSGFGFPSGHTAVATALAIVAGRRLPPTARWLTWGTAFAVGGARQYVGAHLPLDVAGGAALGVAAGSLANLVVDSAGRSYAGPRH